MASLVRMSYISNSRIQSNQQSSALNNVESKNQFNQLQMLQSPKHSHRQPSPTRTSLTPQSYQGPKLLSFFYCSPLTYSPPAKALLAFTQPYLLSQKSFNQYHQHQLLLNQQKFASFYEKILHKLSSNSNLHSLTNPQFEASYLVMAVNTKSAQRLEKSDQKTLAQTTHKPCPNDNGSAVLIEPLIFTKNKGGYKTPKKNPNKKQNYGNTVQKPSSCRTIIMDLEDLIEK